MPKALWILLRLHSRATARRLLRGVRTPRGIVFLALGIVVLCAWLGPSIYVEIKIPHTDPMKARTIAPFGILAFCLGNLLTSVGESAVAFTGAEVDFLFPGPFSRRSLLGYKITKTALGTFFTAFIFGIVTMRYGGIPIACFVGIWLTIQFMQLFAMAATMIGQTVGQRIYGAARRGVLIVIAGTTFIYVAPKFAAGMQAHPIELLRQIHDTLAGRIILAPFDVFGRTLTAGAMPELVIWGSLALLIDLIMLTVVIGLDANYLETSATISQRRYDRIQRMRRGGSGALAGGARKSIRIRPLPWLGGIGPIAWRQLTTVLRNSRGLLIMLMIIAVTAGGILSQHRGEDESAMGPFIGLFVWMNIFFATMLKFDFRDELDRLDLLRSLPIRPLAVAAAELVAPVVVLTGMQFLLLAVLAFTVSDAGPLLLAAVLYAIPFNLLLVGIENFLFLLFPLRAAGLIAGDMQLFGRQMVVFLCKFLLLAVAAGIAAAFGTIGYILGGQSWPAFAVVAWFPLTLIALSSIPLLARQYARFDPSVDTPA